MLFGQPKRGLFGGRRPYGTPGIGDGIGVEAMGTAPPGNPGAQASPKRKVNWGGVAADFLAGLAGREGPYLAMLEHQRKLDDEEAKYNRRRQDENADWQARERFKLENAPDEFDYIDDNAGNRIKINKRTGESSVVYVDRVPKFYVQGDQAVQIPNPFATGQSAIPAAPSIDDWNRATPVGGAGPGQPGFRR